MINNTNYIDFHFILIGFHSSYYLRLKVKNGASDSIYGKKDEYTKLLKNNNYYFYINVRVNKCVSINITMNIKLKLRYINNGNKSHSIQDK